MGRASEKCGCLLGGRGLSDPQHLPNSERQMDGWMDGWVDTVDRWDRQTDTWIRQIRQTRLIGQIRSNRYIRKMR